MTVCWYHAAVTSERIKVLGWQVDTQTQCVLGACSEGGVCKEDCPGLRPVGLHVAAFPTAFILPETESASSALQCVLIVLHGL